MCVEWNAVAGARRILTSLERAPLVGANTLALPRCVLVRSGRSPIGDLYAGKGFLSAVDTVCHSDRREKSWSERNLPCHAAGNRLLRHRQFISRYGCPERPSKGHPGAPCQERRMAIGCCGSTCVGRRREAGTPGVRFALPTDLLAQGGSARFCRSPACWANLGHCVPEPPISRSKAAPRSKSSWGALLPVFASRVESRELIRLRSTFKRAGGGRDAAAHRAFERCRVVGADVVAGQPQAGQCGRRGRARQAGAA